MKQYLRLACLVLTSQIILLSNAMAINDTKDTNKNTQNENKPAQNSNIPQRTETTNYDNWIVSCRENVDGKSKKTCSAIFQLIEKERKNVLLVWIIGKSPDGNLMSFIQVPTGIYVEKGIELKIGNEGVTRKMNFVTCEPTRCEAVIQMDNSMSQELSAAQKATATVISNDGRIAKFELNIKGIDKSLSEVTP